ncbi:MAG: hypothetical protein O2857_07520 [Planctomycetota bacterium]|nr:hypothetical protein [Planctomycetota bacterium]
MKPTDLEQFCDAFRSRLRNAILLAGLCRLILMALALLPGLFLLDWWLHLASGWRVLTLLSWTASLSAVYWLTLHRPARASWSNREVLAYIDSVLPADQGMLLEHYELIQSEGIEEIQSDAGREMVTASLANVDELVKASQNAELLNRLGIRRWMHSALALVVVLSAAAFPLQYHLRIGVERFFNPFSSLRWPTRTVIVVSEPKTGWTVPQMESFEINAAVSGVIPDQILLAYRSESSGTWTKERIRLTEDNQFSYTFPEVRERFSVYLTGGDFTSDTYDVSIVERPYIKVIEAHYDYPDYAGVPDRMVESGQLIGLEGTSVRLKWECSMALEKALFVLDGSEPEQLRLTSPTAFEKTLLLREDGLYAIELYEKNGYREARPERYDIRVTPDHPPEVEMLAPGKDIVVTPRASFPVLFLAKDDFGLAKVEFMVQVDDGEPYQLTDKITGPLQQSGKTSEGRFAWKLSQSDLPQEGNVSYFVRVQDINPTGRGKAATAKSFIQLVKPSEFHLEVLRRAKRLDTEARIAWENQLKAWKLGTQWQAEGTGDEGDPIWRALEESQTATARASSAMEMHLREITEAYEQNDMSREFMAARLGQVADLLKHLTEKLLSPIAGLLKQTRPTTAADAQADRLKQIRLDGLKKCQDEQKLAVLYCERMLRKLYDWRDLQTTLVKATLLHEEQDEVLGLTEGIAPKFIGAEIEDLSDKDQDGLLTLAKRQQTLYDVETELENLLVAMRFKANKQKRKSIEDPLAAAYQGLRSKRVNDNLKTAARLIGNNQPFQVINNQKAALHALNIVKGGLFLAGQEADKDETITLAMAPSEFEDFEEAKIAKANPNEQKPIEATESPAEVQALTPEQLLDELPIGSDAITAALQLAWETQDSVLSRTRYLSENSSDIEMPRYIRLKLGILLEIQETVFKALGRGIEEARKLDEAVVLAGVQQTQEELLESRKLLITRQLGKGIQQIQADAMASLKDLQQYISFKKSVAGVAEENRLREGKDTFGRSYLLRSADLGNVVSMTEHLSHARVLLRDSLRKVTRFDEFKAPVDKPELTDMEKGNHGRAAASFSKAIDLSNQCLQLKSALTGSASGPVDEANLPAALNEVARKEFVQALFGIADPATLKIKVQNHLDVVEHSLQALRDLLEERERPKTEVASTEMKEIKLISQEELERMYSPESLRERLKVQKDIPDEIKEIMMRALTREFPPKYRELLKAYYGSFLDLEETR